MQNQTIGNITREEKLEAALTELIELAAILRYRQRRWEDSYGSQAKDYKKTAEAKMDKVLKEMGVNQISDFKIGKLKFLKELTVEEMEDLSKSLIK